MNTCVKCSFDWGMICVYEVADVCISIHIFFFTIVLVYNYKYDMRVYNRTGSLTIGNRIRVWCIITNYLFVFGSQSTISLQ